jgi:hypothetical protein
MLRTFQYREHNNIINLAILRTFEKFAILRTREYYELFNIGNFSIFRAFQHGEVKTIKNILILGNFQF